MAFNEPPVETVDSHPLREVIPLCNIAADNIQFVKHRRVLHSFADTPKAQVVAEVNNGPSDRRVAFVVTHVGDETSVDLEF